jgi:hypothetical protein
VFRLLTPLLSGLSGIVLLVWAVNQFNITKADKDSYYNNLAKVEQANKQILEDKNKVLQKKTNVTKNFWVAKEKIKEQIQIHSETSSLLLEFTPSKVTGRETLHNIIASVQNNRFLNKSNQEFYTFSAKEGIYSFPPHEFMAPKTILKSYELTQNVNLTFDRLPPPFFTAQATNFKLEIENQQISMKAHHLKTFYQQNEENN